MSTYTVRDKFLQFLEEVLCVEKTQIRDESTWEDLGADSLDTVEIMIAVKEEFDLEVTDEDAEKIKTVGEAIAAIAQRRIV